MKPLRRWSLFRPRTDGASPFNQDDDTGSGKTAPVTGEAGKEAPVVGVNADVAAPTIVDVVPQVGSVPGGPTNSSALPTVGIGVRNLPRPALRWVGQAGRIALREFDFTADADIVCSFQQETYVLNFPDFRYTESFAAAFRHDLRRAALDPHHGMFVLDSGQVVGFLWLVVCENTWTGERYGYINNIYVAPTQWGNGLGRELMRQADSFFRSRGIKRLRLTVTTSNQIAAELYRRCGYEVARWEMEKEL